MRSSAVRAGLGIGGDEMDEPLLMSNVSTDVLAKLVPGSYKPDIRRRCTAVTWEPTHWGKPLQYLEAF